MCNGTVQTSFQSNLKYSNFDFGLNFQKSAFQNLKLKSKEPYSIGTKFELNQYDIRTYFMKDGLYDIGYIV